MAWHSIDNLEDNKMLSLFSTHHQEAHLQVSNTEKEAAMMREKAQVEAEHQRILAETAWHKTEEEASLYVLEKERSATANLAEVVVYEAATEMEEEPLRDFFQMASEDQAQRTSKYMQTHSFVPHAEQAPVSQQLLTTPTHVEILQHNAIATGHLVQTENILLHLVIKDENESVLRTDHLHDPPFTQTCTTSLTDYSCEAPQIKDFAKYLVRREMVSSGVFRFDDHPEELLGIVSRCHTKS